jgi:hypothetical protein
MLKKSLLTLVAGLFTFATFAQKGLEFGVYVTPQNTWIFNQQDFDADSRLDFRPTIKMAFGASAGYNFTDNLGVQTGICYSSQGQNYKSTIGSLTSEFSADLTYLRIPVLFKYNSDPSSSSSFLVNAGLDFGIKTGATANLTSPTTSSSDISANYNSMDIAAVFGFGAQFKLVENVYLTTMFRFSYSISTIESDQGKAAGLQSSTGTRDAANNFTGGLQIGAKYVLPMGK